MRNRVERCVLCRSQNITTESENERTVTAVCHACGATVRVEFDPPDAPELRGRIEVVVDPKKSGPDETIH